MFSISYFPLFLCTCLFLKAAYAGIATRNGGLNDAFGHSTSRIAVNALAAAYVLTRETISGTVASTGVRASLGPPYVVFMILPLLFIVPLLFFVTRRPPPVPQSVWDILVLGRGADNIPRQRVGSDCPFPRRPENLAIGITVSEQADINKLGIAGSFVPFTLPRHEQKSGFYNSPSRKGASEQERPEPHHQRAPQDAELPERREIVEDRVQEEP